MPLPTLVDMNAAEESQYRLFQIKVYEKMFSQLDRYYRIERDDEKVKQVLWLMRDMGVVLNTQFETNLEKDLYMKHIFDSMFEFF